MKLIPKWFAVAALLALSGAALAGQDYDHGHDHGNDRGHDHGHGDNHGHDDHAHYDRRPGPPPSHRDHAPPPRYYGGHPMPPPPPPHFYRGGRPLPPPPGYRWERGGYYRGPVYVVGDYGYYHLRRPPYGYHWIRGDDGDFLLVAVATGAILDIVLH